MNVIGVTGTKGKTTITNYISEVLNRAGINTGVVGTNGTFYNNISETEKTSEDVLLVLSQQESS